MPAQNLTLRRWIKLCNNKLPIPNQSACAAPATHAD